MLNGRALRSCLARITAILNHHFILLGHIQWYSQVSEVYKILELTYLTASPNCKLLLTGARSSSSQLEAFPKIIPANTKYPQYQSAWLGQVFQEWVGCLPSAAAIQEEWVVAFPVLTTHGVVVWVA